MNKALSVQIYATAMPHKQQHGHSGMTRDASSKSNDHISTAVNKVRRLTENKTMPPVQIKWAGPFSPK